MSYSTVFTFLLLLSGFAFAQGQSIFAPNCTAPEMDWTFNSLRQNPCVVGAYMMSTCNNGSFTVPQLEPPQAVSYMGAYGAASGDLCMCNTVAYSLMSACGACQKHDWRSFPNPVPAGTRVPHWAFDDSSTSDFANQKGWDPLQAMASGDSPEVGPPSGTCL
ncbi:hypothetical protein BGW80DRAFT_1255818 [Lactifluus volemus]|nr:hypothetical protein BGW80DRAFT_1255818 [Lactifluus volemus]